MLAFIMKPEVAALFYDLCEKYKLEDEETRAQLLMYMASKGMMDNVVESKMTEDEYVEHLGKNFDIKDMRGEHNEEGTDFSTETDADGGKDKKPD